MRRFFLFLWISSLLLAACFISSSAGQVPKSDTYSLRLQGFVWNHSTLNVLVVTADNESWWNPAYLNVTLRAIGQWNDAIAAFAANNSDFSYLYSLSLQPTVSNVTLPGYDVYVNWTDSSLSNMTDEVGLSQITPNFRSTIINCTTTLSVHTNHGSPLDNLDMQNIALHELGHSLGLGHSNYTQDLMYSTYNIGNSGEDISTLDVYGVATLFGWETLNATSFYPVSSWLNVSSVSLSSTAYQGLPVTPENAPQMIDNNSVVQFLVLMFEILIHPEILAIVILFFGLLIIIALIPKRKRATTAKANL